MNSDMKFMLDTVGKEILVDNVRTKALVTNPTISEFESKYVHTIEPIKQGAIVTIDNKPYLNVFDNVALRHDKYKTKVDYCNQFITIEGETTKVLLVDANGKPILDKFGLEQFKTVIGDPILVPTIFRDYKGVQFNGTQFLVSTVQAMITVQDNALNLAKFTLNSTINVLGKYKVMNIDKSKTGLLNILCEK